MALCGRFLPHPLVLDSETPAGTEWVKRVWTFAGAGREGHRGSQEQLVAVELEGAACGLGASRQEPCGEKGCDRGSH